MKITLNIVSLLFLPAMYVKCVYTCHGDQTQIRRKVQHCIASYTVIETRIYIYIVNVLLQHENRGGNPGYGVPQYTMFNNLYTVL
jgi:hypothetical protein